MPFNFTGDREEDYFVKGFHDDLIGTLGQMSNLRVISRTSTLQYEEQNLPLQQIAKELGVGAIIEGSLSGSGERKFIQLQLIDVFPKERHIWSKRYQQDIQNIFAIEKDITKNVLNKLQVHITPQEETLLANSYFVNPDAYRAYLKGMLRWDRLNEKDFNIAMEYFDLALKFDPNFALAYAGKSLVWMGRLQQGLVPHEEGANLIEITAQKALELDSTLSEVHYTLGVASSWVDWNFKKSAQQLKSAIQLNPNHSYARAYLAHVLHILHQPNEAIKEIEKANSLDPLNPLFKALYGMNLNFTGQYDKALEVLVPTLESDPNNSLILATLRTTYHLKNMYPEALEIWKASCTAEGDYQAIEVLNKGEEMGGYSSALESFAELLVKRSDTCYVTPWRIATLYTRAGNYDKAIDYLEKAYEVHDSNMPYISIDPIFDDMRKNERFQKLLEKMNLPSTDPRISISSKPMVLPRI